MQNKLSYTTGKCSRFTTWTASSRMTALIYLRPCVCLSVCQVVHSREGGERIYLGTQSAVLQTGLLMTRVEYPASPQRPVTVSGRVEFFDLPHAANHDDVRRCSDDDNNDNNNLVT